MLATRPTVHGKAKPHLTRWQAEQQAQQEISKYQFRAPSFWLYRDDPAHRANVTVYLTLKNNIVETANVVLTHHRTERRYNHITIASLKRLSSIAPLPLLTADQFAAMDEAMVAAEMLTAARAQADRKPGQDADFRLLDRVDAAIAYGQVAEMVNDEHEVAA